MVVADREKALRELRRCEERRADRREPTCLLGVFFDAAARDVEGMTPRTSTGASPASRRTTTIEPRNPLEEAAWRGIDTASEISRIEFRL